MTCLSFSFSFVASQMQWLVWWGFEEYQDLVEEETGKEDQMYSLKGIRILRWDLQCFLPNSCFRHVSVKLCYSHSFLPPSIPSFTLGLFPFPLSPFLDDDATCDHFLSLPVLYSPFASGTFPFRLIERMCFSCFLFFSQDVRVWPFYTFLEKEMEDITLCFWCLFFLSCWCPSWCESHEFPWNTPFCLSFCFIHYETCKPDLECTAQTLHLLNLIHSLSLPLNLLNTLIITLTSVWVCVGFIPECRDYESVTFQVTQILTTVLSKRVLFQTRET